MRIVKFLNIVFLIIIFKIFPTQFLSPTITPLGTSSPSISFSTSQPPQIASDDSGGHLYAIWTEEVDPDKKIIQVAISSDFGNSWENPTSTLWGSPNLSDPSLPAGKADDSQITTSSSGQYVYATWTREDGVASITQVGISSDFGKTWVNPLSTPTDQVNPNPDISTTTGQVPQIATDSTGQYVYIIWAAVDGFDQNIQTTISSDFGKTWVFPDSTPIDPLNPNPNLSVISDQSLTPEITTDKSGKYVYAIWLRHDLEFSGNLIVQTASSSDFGKTWVTPLSTPVDTLNPNPNLSPLDYNSFVPLITTDDSGKYVYAIWAHDNGINFITQIAISSDFGNNWTNPASTLYGVPTLSDPTQRAEYSQITTDGTGKNVYVIWSRNDGTHYVIQVAISSNYGLDWQNPISTPIGAGSNLSDPNYDSDLPQIVTSNDGKYVYATWQLSTNLSESIVQIAISSSYGKNWKYPIATLPGINTPNLTFMSDYSSYPQITSSSSGQYINIIWYSDNGLVEDIKTCRGVMGIGFFPISFFPERN